MNLGLDLVLRLAQALFEFNDTFAQRSADLGQTPAEEQESDETDHDHLGHAEVLKKGKRHDGGRQHFTLQWRRYRGRCQAMTASLRSSDLSSMSGAASRSQTRIR